MASNKIKRIALRAVKWLGVIAIVGVVGLLCVEGWRQYRVLSELDELLDIRNEAQSHILKGKTARSYFAERVDGTNGWSVWNQARNAYEEAEKALPGSDEFIRGDSEIVSESLSFYDYDEWAELSIGIEDYDSVLAISDEEIAFYFKKSEPIAKQVFHAASFDVIAPNLADGAYTFMETLGIVELLLARVATHLHFDRPKEAFEELGKCIEVTEKMSSPCSFIDILLVQALRREVWKWVAHLSTDETFPPETLKQLTEVTADSDSVFEQTRFAISGETLFLIKVIKEEGILESNSWFDWVYKQDDDGWSEAFGTPSLYSFSGAYDLREMVMLSLERGLAAVRTLESGKYPSGPWLDEVGGFAIVQSWDDAVAKVKFNARQVDQQKCAVHVRWLMSTGEIDGMLPSVIEKYEGIVVTEESGAVTVGIVYDQISKLGSDAEDREEFTQVYKPIVIS